PHALEIQPDRGDPLIAAQVLDQLLGCEARLVADGEHDADRERTAIEKQIECDRAALADERHAALAPLSDELIGPERRTVEEVDEAVAVGAEEGQVTGAREQLLGEAAARLGSGLGEPGGKADE